MNTYSLLSLLAFFLYLYIGVLTRSRYSEQKANQVFFYLCMALAVWAFAYSFVYPVSHESEENIWFWYRISALGWCTVPAIALHFSLVLTRQGLAKKRWIYLLIYLPSIIFLYRVFTGVLIAYSFRQFDNINIELIDASNMWFMAFVLYYLIYIVMVFYMIMRWGANSPIKREQKQSRLIVASGILATVISQISNFVWPLMGVHFPSLAPISMTILAIGVWYAIIKYQFMNLTSANASEEILKRVQDLIILVDPLAKVVRVNRKLTELLSYCENEVEGLPLYTLFFEHDEVMEKFKRLIDNESVGQMEVHCRSKSGEQIPVNIYPSAVRGKNGAIIGIVVVAQDMRQTRQLQQEVIERRQVEEELIRARDELEQRVNERTVELVNANEKLQVEILERKLSEANLQVSEERYRNLFEKSPVGLLRCNKRGGITDVNQSYLNILKAPVKQVARDLNLITNRSVLLPQIENWSKVFDEGISLVSEIQFVSYWGKYLWVQYKIDPVKDENGDVMEVIIACEDITERKGNEEKIKFLSFNDSLTGVYNRAFFNQEVKRLDVPRQWPLSMIMGDVNGLKLVNDAFGHHQGDKILINITRILRTVCREEDIIARWGGDEFIILLPQTVEKDAEMICERIRKACREAKADPIQASIALGTAVKESKDENIYDVLSRAEDRMYRNKLIEGESVRSSIIYSLENKLNERTMESRGHTERIQSLSLNFAKALGLSSDNARKLSVLAKLHDIGKIAIPDDILSKPAALSQNEWEIVKKHPEIGYRILQSSHEFSMIAEEVLSHHERWDGTGYPRGLKEFNIPQLARILTIVDAYELMTNGSVYKQPVSHQEALDELTRCAGSQFDPYLVEKFISLFETEAACTINAC